MSGTKHMDEGGDDLAAPSVDMMREILSQRLQESRAAAYLATINAEAGRAAAPAVPGPHATSLNAEALASDKKAQAYRAAAKRFGELLAALPQTADDQ